MAISYDLQLATGLSAAEVAGELYPVALVDRPDAGSLTGAGLVSRGGSWLKVTAMSPPAWHPVIADLGFAPTVFVTFRMDTSGDLRAQQDDMVSMAAGLLGRIEGDAVLHFQYEVIWLLRRGSELVVSDREDIWPPHRLATLPEPFTRGAPAFAEV